MFHGIGRDYLITSATAHKELLVYLANHRDEIRITTFHQAMDEVMLRANRQQDRHGY